MGKKLKELTPELSKFIQSQKVFFTGTAADSGRINISPKGMDSLRVISANRIIWMNLTGSGNETAAHLLQNNRMTLMFCAFEGKPLILRLYGKAKIYHPGDPEFRYHARSFNPGPGARQVFDMSLELVQTSCGFGVPVMEYKKDRDMLTRWAEKKGPQGINAYWNEKNRESIDGFPTGILND